MQPLHVLSSLFFIAGMQQPSGSAVEAQPGQLQLIPLQQPQPQPQPQQLQQAVSGAATWQQLDNRSIALVATDVCLKALHRDFLPLGLPLLIQYDLPSTKVRDTYVLLKPPTASISSHRPLPSSATQHQQSRQLVCFLAVQRLLPGGLL